MRIAYVEDNPTNLALVERVANMNQHTIVSYSEGEVALQELSRETFDLILMDVELAGEMGGLQVVRQLRAGGLKTPIIAVTAYAMQGDRDKCIEAGCNDYLPKPMPINSLLAILAKYQPAGAGEAAPAQPKTESAPTPASTPAAQPETRPAETKPADTAPAVPPSIPVSTPAPSATAQPAPATPPGPANGTPTTPPAASTATPAEPPTDKSTMPVTSEKTDAKPADVKPEEKADTKSEESKPLTKSLN